MKCAALCVIGDFIALDDKSETFQSTSQLLAEYSHDHEPRVRTEALNALVSIFLLYTDIKAVCVLVECQSLKYKHISLLQSIICISRFCKKNMRKEKLKLKRPDLPLKAISFIYNLACKLTETNI